MVRFAFLMIPVGLLDFVHIQRHVPLVCESVSGSDWITYCGLFVVSACVVWGNTVGSVYAGPESHRLANCADVSSFLMEKSAQCLFLVLHIIQRYLNRRLFRLLSLPLSFFKLSLSSILWIVAGSNSFKIDAVGQDAPCWSLEVYFPSLTVGLVS